MDMIKPELHVVQQIRRDKFRVEQINDFPNTWDHHHHHQNIRIANNLGLTGVLHNQISVPVQTNAYQDCTTNFMSNPQGSSNWRSIDLSQPSSMNCSVVNYGYDQDGISYVEDVFSNHTLGRPDYAGRDTMVHSWMTSRSELSCLEDNQKDRVTVACSGTGNEILKSSHEGSSSGSHRGEVLFLPSLEDQSVAHNASRWNHGLSCKEPLNLTATPHTNKKGVSFSSLSSKIPPLRDGGNADTSSTVNVHKHFGPLGPFTGYASILKSSRFLEPAQKMLEEFCISYTSKIVSGSESTSMDNDDSWGMLSSINHAVDRVNNYSESLEPKINRLKRAKLLFMQEEVIKSYKLYNHQLQTVVSSFNSVAGLSAATPYISLALRRISTSFKDLVTAISEQMKQISSQYSPGGDNNEFQKQQRSSLIGSNVGFAESQQQQHIWKPQRGLPERAVSVLRSWLFDHFLHPYPTDSDKQMLATQTGLSRNQVSNWFINARVRLWKPMVEEIHMLETKAIKNADTSYNVESSKRPNIVSSPRHEETLIMNLPGTKRSRFNNVWDNDMDMRNFHRGFGNVSLELRLRHGVDNVIQTQTQDHDLFRQCYPNAS